MKIRKQNRQNKIERKRYKMQMDNRSIKTINPLRHKKLKFCLDCRQWVKLKRGCCPLGHWIG